MLTRRSFLALGAGMASLMLAACDAEGQGQLVSGDPDGIKVIASIYPLYDFACKLGEGRARVTCLVPSGSEPHDWEPSTADVRRMAEATLFAYNGAGMESWADDVLRGLEGGGLASVEASDGLDLIRLSDEAQAEERAEHEQAVASDLDPHCWLSPLRACQEMENIASALIEVDPEGSQVYQDNLSRWRDRFQALDQDFRRTLEPLTHRDLVVSHEAFGYICADYGLTQVPIEGIEADAEPDAQTMAGIVDFIRERDVKVVFSEELVSPKVAQSIADATGARIEELNPLEGLSQEETEAGDDYFSVMEQNLRKIKEALA